MSKYLKDLITKDISKRLEGVDDLLLVDLAGLKANDAVVLRKRLRDRDNSISLLLVKKNLARRACEGTPLAPAFESIEGSAAIVWGGEDVIDLAKEVISLDGDADFEGFNAKGGVMDGEALTPARVKEISKWPNRTEQLSLLSGQILGPGRNLSAQIKGPGAKLASQVKSIADGDDE
ncbi:MAG: 50S ribosomal protein L10 [Pirellulales bacterium]|jgi:large subunit ribosomal protein L10